MLTYPTSRKPAEIEFKVSTGMPAALLEAHAARPISASARTEIALQRGSQARRQAMRASSRRRRPALPRGACSLRS
jgi:hypothetical protein